MVLSERFNSLSESAGSTSTAGDSFSKLPGANKLLIQHMDDAPGVVISDWSLMQSKLPPMEWAALLNLNSELRPLWQQPDRPDMDAL